MVVMLKCSFFGNLSNSLSGRDHPENLEFADGKNFVGGTSGVSAQVDGELSANAGATYRPPPSTLLMALISSSGCFPSSRTPCAAFKGARAELVLPKHAQDQNGKLRVHPDQIIQHIQTTSPRHRYV
jgi:hypothetical protein